jgi:hypothetical protein
MLGMPAYPTIEKFEFVGLEPRRTKGSSRIVHVYLAVGAANWTCISYLPHAPA